MKTWNLVVLSVLVVTLLGVSSAQASDQKICGVVNLSGFMNSSIKVGYKTTDAFDSARICSPGNSASCSACNGYSAPPKNVGNFLCLPNSLAYTITSDCQNLLKAGSGDGCHGNSGKSYCPSNTSIIAPDCNWRTNNNKSNTNWTWNVSYNGSTQSYTVDCSNSNYQGYQE